MPTPQETKVQRTFDKAMEQINSLQKVFRDEGMMAKAVVDIGGNQDFGAIQEAFDNLYGALEDAHYDAMAHIEVESTKQKLGKVDEVEQGEPIPATIGKPVAAGAQDEKFVYFNAQDGMVKMQVDNEEVALTANPQELADAMKDNFVTSSDRLMHSSDVDFADEEGFETQEGAHMIINKAMELAGIMGESVAETKTDEDAGEEITEGYEGTVLSILKKEGIGAYFSNGKLYVDQADMAEAKSALADNDDIKELPDMVAEELHEGDCGCSACADKRMNAKRDPGSELAYMLKLAGIR